MKEILILSICLLLLAGCAQLDMLPENTAEQGQTINEFFGKEILTYTEETISEKIECVSGDCPESEPELKTVEKDCYFCDVSKIKGNELRLIHDKGQSGSQDFSFGCLRKYEGPVMGGFEVVEKSEDLLKVRGDIEFYFSQKSMHCDKEKDSECDDMTYGSCDGEDYSQVSIRTVEMVFKAG